MSIESDKKSPSIIMLAFSILTHFLLLAPVIYILVVYSTQHYNFFSWHPICMTVGVALIAEGVFIVSGEAYIVSKVSGRNRVTIHWILTTIGLIIIGICFIVIIVIKINKGILHFATTHSQFGLVTIILSVLIAASGVLANNTVWLPQVSPVLIGVTHICGGIGVLILLLAAVIDGLYAWWPDCDTGRNLVFASLVFAGLFIIVKPILGVYSRCRVIFAPPSSDT